MNYLFRISLCLIVLIALVGTSSAKIPDIVLAQKKSVVTIFVYEGDNVIAYGTGFIVGSDGIAITNCHVISAVNKKNNISLIAKLENGDKVNVKNETVCDETHDVGLIKLMVKNLPTVKLAETYIPKQGEDIVVIGSPFGLDTTISNGIISSIRGKDGLLQITAPVSPGSSGSPVFNMNGQVIGIATLVVQEGQNLNFAIPIQYISNTLTEASFAWQVKGSKTEKISPTPSHIQPKKEEIGKLSEEDANLGTGIGPYIKSANKYLEQDEGGKAADEYTKAIVIKPDDPALYYARAITHLATSRTNAIVDINEAIALASDNPILYFVRGCLAPNKEEAVSYFDKAISLKPNVALFYFSRGIQKQLARDPHAIDDFSKAISLGKHIQGPLADMFATIGKYLDSRQHRMRTKGIYPLDVELARFYSERAMSYLMNEQIDKATNDLVQAITADELGDRSLMPNIVDENNRNFLKPLYSKAIAIYSKKISRQPRRAGLYAARAYYFYWMKQYDNAIKDYTKFIKLAPAEASDVIYLTRAESYRALGQFEKAIQDQTAAIELCSTKSSELCSTTNKFPMSLLYAERAKMYEYMKNDANARMYFKMACDKEPIYWCEDLDRFEKRVARRKKDEARGDKWVLIDENDYRSLYYDKTSIKVLPSGHKSAWTRTEITDLDGYNAYLKENNLSASGYKDLSHSLILYECDCQSEQMKTKNYYNYNIKGTVIDSYDKDELAAVIPESIGHAIYQAICSYKPLRVVEDDTRQKVKNRKNK